jgi:hypothetical protein
LIIVISFLFFFHLLVLFLQTLYSMTDSAPPILDIGANCNMPVRFVGDNVFGSFSKVLDFFSGTGLKLADVDLLLRKQNSYEYTIVMDVKFTRTSCWVRLLNFNPTADEGLYLCDAVQLHDAGLRAGRIAPNTWNQIALSTRSSDKLVRIYINGKKLAEQAVADVSWSKSVAVHMGPPDGARDNPVLNPYLSFFNDCGDACNCNGGGGQNAAGRVRQILVFDRMLQDNELEVINQKARSRPQTPGSSP